MAFKFSKLYNIIIFMFFPEKSLIKDKILSIFSLSPILSISSNIITIVFSNCDNVF